MDLYLIVIGKTATGSSAHCPDVPGCAAVGKTIDKAIANMTEALEFHLEGMLEDGEPLPKPSGVDAYRDAMKDPDLKDDLLAHVAIDTSKFAVSAEL